MGARTDFEPLTWEEAEQNLRANVIPIAGLQESAVAQQSALEPEVRARAMAEGAASSLIGSTPDQEERERLENEIRRGREYLAQVQRDLAESLSHLEEWPTYEKTCGRNPLAHLAQAVMVNERISEFLKGWLNRRETRLRAVQSRSALEEAERAGKRASRRARAA